MAEARDAPPLRVLSVSPSFDPAHRFGGPVRSLLGLCRALAARGDTGLRVLTTDAAAPDGRDRLDVPAGWQRHAAGFDIRYCRWWLPPDIAPGLLLALPGEVRRAELVCLDGTYSFTTPATLACCRLFRRPLLWWPRGALMAAGLPLRKRLWNRFCRWLADPARCRLVATSAAEAAATAARLPGLEVLRSPNGVDGPPAPLPPRPADGVLRLLFLGRLHPSKGLEGLLEALALCRAPAELTIHGDGPLAAALQAQAAALGLAGRVRLAGFLSPEAVPQVLAAHDVLVAPSPRENFGNAVAEALAHGRPAIATTGMPWQELEAMGCGLCCAAEPRALAAAIDRLAAADHAAMGARAHAWMARDFSWAVIAGRLHAQALDLARPPARLAIVSSVGGHLTEIRALAPAYRHLPHFYVLNDHVPLPADMAGRTHVISHAERDWRLLVNLWQIWRLFRRERPDIVLSAGAGPAVLAALVGRLLFGCRVIFVETVNRVDRPSLTARLIRPLAHRMFVQWPALLRALPGSRYAGRLL